jgi:hypothetical protein
VDLLQAEVGDAGDRGNVDTFLQHASGDFELSLGAADRFTLGFSFCFTSGFAFLKDFLEDDRFSHNSLAENLLDRFFIVLESCHELHVGGNLPLVLDWPDRGRLFGDLLKQGFGVVGLG